MISLFMAVFALGFFFAAGFRAFDAFLTMADSAAIHFLSRLTVHCQNKK